MLDDETINQAVGRARFGDADAFETIVRRFERPLRSWLAGHAPPGVDVDEIAQRSFIAAYSRLSEFSVGTSFSAWLFTIARYQLRTETTRLRRLADYHSRYAPTILQRRLERTDSETSEVWESRMEHLKECVKQLGDGLSQYLTWRYEDQISIEEMSNATGRSAAAVKKQLWTLRQKLLKCIEQRASMVIGDAK
jgi:RNA polymerase sigma-70 factor, ECF subfamily